MSLAALVNGTLYSRAKGIRVSRSLGAFAGFFEIVSSADENQRLPIRINDRIQIVTGFGQVLLTGFVEALSVRQDAGTHEIRASGRDITADLIDSTLKTKQFNGPIGFLDLITRVLQAQGLGSIKVVNQAGQLAEIKESELIAGEIGESAFGFLERYARRVQAILTTNEDGAILVMRAGTARAQGALTRQTGNPLNNIIESSIDLNVASRFGAYSCQSQLAPAGVNFEGTAEQVIEQSGGASDAGVRASRFFEFEAETAMDAQACRDRARLEANIRRARSLSYQATVQGVPNAFRINRLVPVRDDFCGINATLLISEIEHRFDMGGTTTGLGCTFSDAFSLEEKLATTTAARQETGGGFSVGAEAL